MLSSVGVIVLFIVLFVYISFAIMPKTLRSGERELVLKVKKNCDREKANKEPLIPLDQVRSRVAAMTRVSEKTVTNITKEGAVAASTSSKITTPGKKRSHEKIIKLDDFDICALRHKVSEFYTVRKEVPTLSKLLNEMKADINFTGIRTSLWRIMRESGYRFLKCKNKRKILMERYDIVAWRVKYLNELKNNRESDDPRPVIYLDETYIHSSYSVTKSWQNETEEGVLTSDSKGTRWIIVHAGGENGFVPNARLIFKSQSKSGDYHDDMNRTNFMKWLQEKLVPNLPPRSLVIMDIAPNHSVKLNKPPTMSNTKAEMQEWIESKGLSYLPNMLKAQLYKIIKEHKEDPVYEVDSYLTSQGHRVVRLPPYHCDLNPIELIWSLLKRRVAEKNVSQEAGNIVKLTEEAFDSITAAEWKKECENVEDKYYTKDILLDQELDKIIINVGGDSETDSSDSSDSESGSDISGINPFEEHNYSFK